MNSHMLDWSARGNRPTLRNCRLFLLASFLLSLCTSVGHTEPYPDRLVWVFGWNLNRDRDVAAVTEVVQTASQHGLNGAVVSAGLDTLCRKTPDYFERLDRIREECQRNHVELENFSSNPHGHGRVMQEVQVQPNRCYRIQICVKTQSLSPANALKVQVLASNRALVPRELSIPATSDWRSISMLFNSLDFATVRLYAGVWGGQSGKLWIDDWTLEEVGPLNMLNRPGTPVTVCSEDGSVTYTEARDYFPLEDPQYNTRLVDREPPSLKLRPHSRIRDGQRLRVSWYHSLAINRSQVTVCMAEPKLYEIFDHEAALLAEKLSPRRVMLNMDEVRMGGTCAACRGGDMGELLGQCITKQVQILRRHLPGAEIYIWSDMLDPHHNAHRDYCLVDGDFTGSWKHVPKDLVIAVWGGSPREKSLRFFADEGFQTLAACYYDADDLEEVKGWLRLARQTPNVQGLMYTPWQKKYALLPQFGALLNSEP